MPETQRLFVAVTISSSLLRRPDGRRSVLANVLRELSFCGNAVRPTEPEKLHVTLKFLGETRSELLPQIKNELAAIAVRHEEFSLQLRGLGVFPNLRQPAVCWAGVSEAEALMVLAADVEDRISRLGFPTERRAFHPHLTLARIRAKPAAAFFELLSQHPATDFGTDRITSLILMRSSWPVPGSYQVVSEWPLRDSAGVSKCENPADGHRRGS